MHNQLYLQVIYINSTTADVNQFGIKSHANSRLEPILKHTTEYITE